jgi:hypothetical protein
MVERSETGVGVTRTVFVVDPHPALLASLASATLPARGRDEKELSREVDGGLRR